MNNKNLFKKYYSRLFWEGIIKTFICSFIVGFTINFLSALTTYFISSYSVYMNYSQGLWLSISLGLIGIIGSAPIFYFVKFRPTSKKIVDRIDRLGLEERILTMVELEKDQSYIALCQREDAKSKLKALDHKKLRLSIFKVPVIVVMAIAVLGISMTTVVALSEKGVISAPGTKPGTGDDDPIEYISVSYLVEEGGFIDGEAEQLIVSGTDASTVIAVADDGYMFQQWSDELTTPERTDLAIKENLEVTAIFVAIGEGEDNQGGEPGDPGDEPSDEPSGGNEGETPPDGDPNNSGGGKYEDYNQIIDGETYYRDVLKEYYDLAMQILSEGGELSPELRAIIQSYFGIIV